MSKMLKPLLCAMLLCSPFAMAESRVEKIKRTQTVTVGYMDDDFPFSYINDKGVHEGYGVDITKAAVERMSKELGVPLLHIEVKPITFQNRFEIMQSGVLDFSCSAHSNLPERKKLVDFSYNFFVARGRLMVHKDSGINSYKDLVGKNVAVIAGAGAEATVDKKRFQFKYEEPIKVNSSDELFELLRNGKVQGIFDDDIWLLGATVRNKEADKFKMIGQAISLDNYACILPKGDTEMKNLLDKALFHMFTTGQMEPLFKRWFIDDIPNLGVKLNFEFNQSIKNLYASPNDHAIGGQ